jgi:hypothetical protein
MISKLFWHRKTITVQEDGLIKFSVNKNRYEYQIYEPETFFITQNSKVKVYFDEQNLSEIHIFNHENRFIGSVEPRLEYDGSNEPMLIKHRTGRKAISKYARDLRKKWSQSSSQVDSHKSNKALTIEFHDFLIDDTDSDSERVKQLECI